MSLEKIITDAIEADIAKYAKTMEKLLKEEVHVSSGALQDSIATEKKAADHFLVGVDSAKLAADPRNASKTDYSVPYHDGHRAYTVRPVRASVLRWIGKDGKVHFARYVKIPASVGDKFVARAMARRPKL